MEDHWGARPGDRSRPTGTGRDPGVRRILLAHASGDTVTRPADTWAYARQAREASRVTAIEVRGSEHAMLRRAALWHELAAEFTRAALGLPAGDQRIRQLLDQADPGPDRFPL